MTTATAVFTAPVSDTAEARVTRDEPIVREMVQSLEVAIARCALDPERDALEERAILKAVRLLDKHLSDVFGPDSVRAAFRQALYALGDLRATRTPFLLSDDVTVLWIDLYPAAGEDGRAAHVYLDADRVTLKARARWARIAPKPTKAVAAPILPDILTAPKPPRPSKRMESSP